MSESREPQRSPGGHVPEARGLDAIARALFAPLLSGAIPGGWRAIGWDVEQGFTLTMAKGDRALLLEFEDHRDDRPCYAQTRRFNVCVRHSFRADQPLDEEERNLVRRIVAVVQAAELRLPVVERQISSRRSQVREILVERALMPEGVGHYYFNPYVGCMIGCEFCYVAERADLSRRMEGLPKLPWGAYVDVKVNAAEVLRREVRQVPPGVVRMSPILTDPYQPLERRYRITRAALEVFLEAGFTPVVLTRAARVVEDLDLLRQFKVAAVGFSIPTDDDRVRRAFEPGADPIEERFAALEACHRAGVRTFCVVQPVLPMDPARLVERTAPFSLAVRIDRMHQVERNRALYEAAGRLDALEDQFFERTEAALREGYARHGVLFDDLDDLTPLITRRAAE